MPKIAIVGAGLIGRAWAISFARAGHDVAVTDDNPDTAEKALVFAAEALPMLAAEDLLEGQTPAEVHARLQIAPSLQAALDGAVHVQESTPEVLDVKKRVFAALDAAAAPETVLASSTSSLLPSAFTEALPGRARCLVVHPINPPYLVPAAEIVPAPWTDLAVVERTRVLITAAGQSPIVMRNELPGFVMNRMQAALIREAYNLVAGGHVSVEDVDRGIREGLALRWSFIGPFETMDLNAPDGMGDYMQRYAGILGEILASMRTDNDFKGPAVAAIAAECRKLRPAATLKKRTLWRDRRLMALAAHKRRADRDIGT